MADETIFANLEDALFGLAAAVTATQELLIAGGAVDAEALTRTLQARQDEFLLQKNVAAATMLGFVLQPLKDPRKQAARKMAAMKPKGNA